MLVIVQVVKLLLPGYYCSSAFNHSLVVCILTPQSKSQVYLQRIQHKYYISTPVLPWRNTQLVGCPIFHKMLKQLDVNDLMEFTLKSSKRVTLANIYLLIFNREKNDDCVIVTWNLLGTNRLPEYPLFQWLPHFKSKQLDAMGFGLN